MRTVKRIVVGVLLVATIADVGLSGSAQAVLPPGYTPAPGPIPLNPAHVGAVGSQFDQNCRSVSWPRGVADGP